MSKKPSLVYQANEALKSQIRFGQSKHAVKKEARELGILHETPGIFSVSTMKTYRYHSIHFVRWIRIEYPSIRVLADAKQHVVEYLILNSIRYAASSIKGQASALRKLYKDHSIARDIEFNQRLIVDFSRSREETISDKHFSAEKNKDLVDFCTGTGLRREGTTKSIGEDFVMDVHGIIWVHTIEKGNRERWAPVLERLSEKVWEIATRNDPKDLIFKNVHKTADIHSMRADYARELYIEGNNGLEYVRYHPNHEVFLYVAEALGHSRESVVINNYMHRVKKRSVKK